MIADRSLSGVGVYPQLGHFSVVCARYRTRFGGLFGCAHYSSSYQKCSSWSAYFLRKEKRLGQARSPFCWPVLDQQEFLFCAVGESGPGLQFLSQIMGVRRWQKLGIDRGIS